MFLACMSFSFPTQKGLTMNFLKATQDAIFWRSNFDDHYRINYSGPVSRIAVDLIGNNVEMALEEKRFFFRESKSVAFLSSSEAATRAFVAFCDDYRYKMQEQYGRSDRFNKYVKLDLMHFSKIMAFASFECKSGGSFGFGSNSVLSCFFVNDYWQDLFDDYCFAKETAKIPKDLIKTFEYPKETLDDASEELYEGSFSSEVGQVVWKAINQRMTAWEISKFTSVDLVDVVFWLRLFRSLGVLELHWIGSEIGPFYSQAPLWDLPNDKALIAEALQ
jgi:hypothetical protein